MKETFPHIYMSKDLFYYYYFRIPINKISHATWVGSGGTLIIEGGGTRQHTYFVQKSLRNDLGFFLRFDGLMRRRVSYKIFSPLFFCV